MKKILFKRKFLYLIISGKKTQTIRNWKNITLQIGEIVRATNVKDGVNIIINSINKKKFSEVTEKEAILDEFENLKELKEEVSKFYEDLDFEAYIINFSLVK